MLLQNCFLAMLLTNSSYRKIFLKGNDFEMNHDIVYVIAIILIHINMSSRMCIPEYHKNIQSVK